MERFNFRYELTSHYEEGYIEIRKEEPNFTHFYVGIAGDGFDCYLYVDDLEGMVCSVPNWGWGFDVETSEMWNVSNIIEKTGWKNKYDVELLCRGIDELLIHYGLKDRKDSEMMRAFA